MLKTTRGRVQMRSSPSKKKSKYKILFWDMILTKSITSFDCDLIAFSEKLGVSFMWHLYLSNSKFDIQIGNELLKIFLGKLN